MTETVTGQKVDYNRGLMKHTHAPTGIAVYMYFDDPGVYLNAYGFEVSKTLAENSGYDVGKWGKERTKRLRMAEAKELIEIELDAAEEYKPEVVKELKGFKVLAIGLGRHHVKDPDGNQMTEIPMPLEQALGLLEKMVPSSLETGTPSEEKVTAEKEVPTTQVSKGNSPGTEKSATMSNAGHKNKG